MQNPLYIEINVICMLLSAIVYVRINDNRSIRSTSQINMHRLIVALWVLCISDIVAAICRGQFFFGDRVLLWISNSLYLAIMPVISMVWLFYVCSRIGKKWSKLQTVLWILPAAAFAVVVLTNPLHHFLFTIDEQNLYSRGVGVFLHWIISWSYFIVAGWLSVKEIRTAGNWVRRNELMPLLYFLILPAIGCVAQMLLYGITSVQVGITISIVLISLQNQDNQITIDELTGINNRKALRRHIDNLVHKNTPPHVSVMMIDVNKFKHINDTFGHGVGDVVLKETASVLSGVCGRSKEELFLCRYGGDEFVIVGENMAGGSEEKIVRMIHEGIHAANAEKTSVLSGVELTVSVGFASGTMSDLDGFKALLSAADEEMYIYKRK